MDEPVPAAVEAAAIVASEVAAVVPEAADVMVPPVAVASDGKGKKTKGKAKAPVQAAAQPEEVCSTLI